MSADELIEVDLTQAERRLLRCGIAEWGGPAHCTEEMAIAMGFRSVADLFAETPRLIAELESGKPLSRLDWCRVLLATEIVFASDVVGSGWDWQTTVGIDDSESLATLRGVQRKLVGRIQGVIGVAFGTRPSRFRK